MVIEINNKPKLENLSASNKIPNIQVVNGKNTGFIGEDLIYIGRENKYKGLPQSPLANPYKLGQLTRSQAIAKFQIYFDNECENPRSEVHQEMLRLAEIYHRNKRIKLVCWCSPQSCHGDVIRDTLIEVVAIQNRYREWLWKQIQEKGKYYPILIEIAQEYKETKRLAYEKLTRNFWQRPILKKCCQYLTDNDPLILDFGLPILD